jgi:hypothetical protein
MFFRSHSVTLEIRKVDQEEQKTIT